MQDTLGNAYKLVSDFNIRKNLLTSVRHYQDYLSDGLAHVFLCWMLLYGLKRKSVLHITISLVLLPRENQIGKTGNIQLGGSFLRNKKKRRKKIGKTSKIM